MIKEGVFCENKSCVKGVKEIMMNERNIEKHLKSVGA
nr:MAG TPA: hypothetical protein [Caudoviricetes sp.]